MGRRHGGTPSPSWRQFLAQHGFEIWACVLLTVQTLRWGFAIFSTPVSIWCAQIKCVSAAFGADRRNWGSRPAKFYSYFTMAYDFARLSPIRNCSRITLPRLGSRVQIPFPAPIKSMRLWRIVDRKILSRHLTPIGQSGGSKLLEDLAAVEIALMVEVVLFSQRPDQRSVRPVYDLIARLDPLCASFVYSNRPFRRRLP